MADIISPAVLYPPSLAKLLDPTPILHLTPEDLADDELDEASVSDDKEGEDRISEMSIGTSGSVDDCNGDTMSGWETYSAATSGSMPSTSDDVHFPDSQTDTVNNEVLASLSPKKRILAMCALITSKAASRSSI